jgi:cytochrome c553
VFFAGKGSRSAPVVGTPPPAAQVCTSCHGSDGKPVSPDYPNLSGQHADYLVQALRDYKSGKRKNAIMAGLVGSLTDKDMDAIAYFYSKQVGLCDTKQILDNNGQCKN